MHLKLHLTQLIFLFVIAPTVFAAEVSEQSTHHLPAGLIMDALTENPLPALEVKLSAREGKTFIKNNVVAKSSNSATNATTTGDTDADLVYKSYSQSPASGYITTYTSSACSGDSPFMMQGGFIIDKDVSLVASYRYDYSTWKWKVVNVSGSSKNITLYTVCSRAPEAYVSKTAITMYGDLDGIYGEFGSASADELSEIPSKVAAFVAGYCDYKDYDGDGSKEEGAVVAYGFKVVATDGSTPTSGHLTDLYTDDSSYYSSYHPYFEAWWYNASSKSVKLTLTYTCMENVDSFWYPAEIYNLPLEENIKTVEPSTIVWHRNTCDNESNSDTVGGGTSWAAIDFDGDYNALSSEIKLLGDYFELEGEVVDWTGKLRNVSDWSLSLRGSLTCAIE